MDVTPLSYIDKLNNPIILISSNKSPSLNLICYFKILMFILISVFQSFRYAHKESPPLKITLVICYTVLALSVAGVLLSGILGRLEWLALCAVCALALLSITLVLGKNLRIQRMMTEDEYSDDR